jgi:hypothetical protein
LGFLLLEWRQAEQPEMANYDESLDPGAVQILEAFAERDNDGPDCGAEKATALQALAYVLGKNFHAAEATEKDGVFSLAFKVTFDRGEEPTAIKAVARCSQISTAEIELNCQAVN